MSDDRPVAVAARQGPRTGSGGGPLAACVLAHQNNGAGEAQDQILTNLLRRSHNPHRRKERDATAHCSQVRSVDDARCCRPSTAWPRRRPRRSTMPLSGDVGEAASGGSDGNQDALPWRVSPVRRRCRATRSRRHCWSGPSPASWCSSSSVANAVTSSPRGSTLADDPPPQPAETSPVARTISGTTSRSSSPSWETATKGPTRQLPLRQNRGQDPKRRPVTATNLPGYAAGALLPPQRRAASPADRHVRLKAPTR